MIADRRGGGPGRRGHRHRHDAAPVPGSTGPARPAGPSCRPGCSPTTPAPRTCPGCWPRCARSTSTTAAAAGTPCCGTAAPARCPRSCAAPRSGSTWPTPSRPTPGSPAWGALLADLGYQPLVRHVAVTVDTAPSGGTTVRDHVAAALDPHAPRAGPPRPRRARRRSPRPPPPTSTPGSRSPSTRARATPRPPDLLAAVVEVGRWLPGIETASPPAGSPSSAAPPPGG